MRGVSFLIAALAQLFASPAAAQDSFELPLKSGGSAKVVGLPASGVVKEGLSKALEQIRSLHRDGNLDQVRTKLFVDHDVVKTLLKEPHAIIPLSGDEKLAVSLRDGGHVIVPHSEWRKGEAYGWFSAPDGAAKSLKAALLPKK